MRVLGIIPARGGSKGIPGKNIKILGNKPLLAYTIESANNSKLLTKLILSSNDSEIINCAKKYNVQVPFKRPDELATDESPSILTVIHALKELKAQGEEFDAVCILQVTSPFRSKDIIDKAILKFEQSKTDSLVSVLKVPREYNPHWVFEKDLKGGLIISTGEKNIISRRQDLPDAFYRDGSIYITKTTVILNQQSLYGKSISYIESDSLFHVNIDTMEDWKKAEEIQEKYNL